MGTGRGSFPVLPSATAIIAALSWSNATPYKYNMGHSCDVNSLVATLESRQEQVKLI